MDGKEIRTELSASILIAGTKSHILIDLLKFIKMGIEPKPEIPFSWVVNNLMNPEHFSWVVNNKLSLSVLLHQFVDFKKADGNSCMLKENCSSNRALGKADVSELSFSSGSVDVAHVGAALHCWPSPLNDINGIGASSHSCHQHRS